MIPLRPPRQQLLFRRQRGSYSPGRVEGALLILFLLCSLVQGVARDFYGSYCPIWMPVYYSNPSIDI